MAQGFSTPLDIANRALQHCGCSRITSLTQDSKSASAVAFAYDKVRQAELRRNVWRFSIRKAALRAVDTGTMLLQPAGWLNTQTYPAGAIVSWLGLIYYAQGPVAAAVQPDLSPASWVVYFGPLTAELWDPTGQTAYFSGELVYILTGVTPVVYMSLSSGNYDNPGVIANWVATETYNIGQTVTYSSVVYQSTQDLNLNNTPTGAAPWVTTPVAGQEDQMMGPNWLQLDATLVSLQFVYPIGAGPRTQSSTRNAFRLPSGFLKVAPQDPKAGSASYLGAPSGTFYDDWEVEGDWLLSRDQQVIILRFAADVANVLEMDPMFCEGLGARLGLEICEEITQSREKILTISSEYKTFMSEARVVNGIETGATEPPEDDYLSCRY
jgi:hypothetical protein